MKITAFGASYSKKSINRIFAGWAAEQFKNADVELLDLNNFTAPMFTVDKEAEIGYPDGVLGFIAKMGEADLLIISMSEHNGSYTAAFKSLMDWSSRKKMKFMEGKKVFLISTSPGPRGGMGSLEAAKNRFPRHGAEIVATYSLPLFDQNFDPERGIINEELNRQFKGVLEQIANQLN